MVHCIPWDVEEIVYWAMHTLFSARILGSVQSFWIWGLLFVLLGSGMVLGGCRNRRAAPSDLAVRVTTVTPAATLVPVLSVTATSTPAPPALTDRWATAAHLERNGYLDEADSLYGQLAALSDSDVAWRAALAQGRLRHGRGQLMQSAQSLNRFFDLARDPQFTIDDVTIASAHWFWAETRRAQGVWAEAAQAYDRALNGFPALTDYILRQVGQMWLEAGESQRGLGYLERAANATSNRQIQVQIQQQMASVLEAQNDYQGAVDMYDAILAVSQNGYYRAQIQYLAGMALVQASADEQAVARFREAAAAERTSVYAYLALVELVNREEDFDLYNRGYIDYYAGAYSPALEAFAAYWERADAEDYRLPWSLLYAGHTHFKLENYVQALAYYRRVTTDYPDCDCRGAAWHGLLRTYHAVDNDQGYDQTWTAFRQAIPTDPHVALVLAETGYTLLELGDWEEAAIHLLDLVEGFPDDSRAPQALFDLALAALLQEQGDSANVYWERLRTQYPWYQPAAVGYWSGRTLWTMGDSAAARFAWEHTQRHYPEIFHGLAAAQAIRRMDGTSQEMIADMAALAGPTTLLSGDDGSRTFMVDWLHSWVVDTTSMATASTRLEADANLARTIAFVHLGLRTQAQAQAAPLPARYAQDAGALLYLMERFADLELHSFSIQAARQLYYQAPTTQVAELPLYLQQYLFPRHYAELVGTEATTHAIPDLLLYALIRQESLFEPIAVSSQAAQGLSQIIPDTGDWIAMRNGLTDYRTEMLTLPWLNLQFGAYYLRFVYQDLDRNWLTALVSYNAGPGTSRIFRQQTGPDDLLFLAALPLAEPIAYVEAIVANLYHYTRLYG